jgi:NADH dehydrogenase
MNVAITGATGLIGRHLCDSFRRLGWQVRALVRDPCGYPFAAPGVARFVCDLPGRIDAAGLAGADVLVHAAYMTRFTNQEEARRVNEEGSRRLFALGRQLGVSRVLFLSSFSSGADAPSYYGRSKFAIEQQLDPARDVAVRAGLVLAAEGGLFQRIVGIVRRARLVPLVGGRHVVQTVHVADLCRACARAIDRRVTGLVHVAEPEGLPFGDLLRLVARHLGRRRLLLPVPFAPVLAGLRLAELLRVPLGVSSENLLGMRALRTIAVAGDLARLGVEVRDARTSIAELLTPTTVAGLQRLSA